MFRRSRCAPRVPFPAALATALILPALGLPPGTATAQEEGNLTVQGPGSANYELAARFAPYKIRDLVHSTRVSPRWIEDSDRFWYEWESSGGTHYYLVDPDRGTRTEIFDNDRIAALVAQLVHADLLVILTDTEGLHTADPRISSEASLIAEIREIDRELEAAAGGVGNADARGGMASKLSAAKIASWAGVPTVIASSRRPGVLRDAVAGGNVGTLAQPRAERLGARKLWIAFAVRSVGTLGVDEGARRALVERGKSLLAVGVRSVSGEFVAGDAVEVAGPDGEVFAKGLVRLPSARLDTVIGRRSTEHEAGTPEELIHRDDMVLLAP